MKKINPAEAVEALKRAKNPWTRLNEIREFAAGGWESIPEEWLRTYFRWWGVYTQGDGEGVLGGRAGEGRTTPWFMVRIRIPSGLLTADQAHTIADLAEQYGRGLLDITTRHNFQLHWIRIEDLPAVLERVRDAGLTTLAACGDDARNITGCSLAGLDADEICDASPLVVEAAAMLVGAEEFYNLPRKYKVSISGCRVWCCFPEINDLALTATRRGAEIGFSIRVGGGLSNTPHFARRLDAFVRWDQTLPVVRATTELFRDADELRENRKRARLKFLFVRHGWSEQRFLDELHQRLGFRLDPAVPDSEPEAPYRDHVGIHAQKQRGLCYVGAAVSRGRITPTQLRAAADLALTRGSGALRTTTTQNLVVVDIAAAHAGGVASELAQNGLSTTPDAFARGMLACTGSEFCKLSLTETKGFAKRLGAELRELVPAFDQPLRISVTGCPNGCAQHSVADIGLEGCKVRTDAGLEDGFSFRVGGALGRERSFGRNIGFRCPAGDAAQSIASLLESFLEQRQAGQSLQSFLQDTETEHLAEMMSTATRV